MNDSILTFLSNTNLDKLIIISITVIGSMTLKDMISDLSSGFLFWLDPSFKIGDIVYINNKKARIININLRNTILEIIDNGQLRWLYIPNNKVKSLMLEKVIDGNSAGK